MEKFLPHNLTDHMDCKICVLDADGIVLYHNPAFLTCFSQESSLIGRAFPDLPEAYRGISSFEQCLQSGRPQISGKRSFRGHSFRDRSVQDHSFQEYTAGVVTTPLFDDDGRLLCIIEEITLTETPAMASSLGKASDYEEIVISDKAMFDVNQTISRIAYFDSTILIQGESGTGKTALARHIHNSSSRKDKPFITVNCGSIPENLIESELFGYASGAFTGASRKGKAGQVELADGGTLFLDEIGLLPFDLQAKFLQLIQEKTYTPVGALHSKRVDVRIISATNLDLKEQIRTRKFREDLYYRLRVIELFIPPLRERKDAIEPLIQFFLNKYNREFSTDKTITSQAISELKNYSWPGNIRELQYVMERIIVTSTGDSITSNDIPPLHDMETAPRQQNRSHSIVLDETDDFDGAVAAFEKELLTQAYRAHHSSYKVASALGITQSKASRLLRKYGIS